MMQHPGTRGIMATHVKELIKQNADKMLSIWPMAPLGIYSAGLNKRDAMQPLIFGGVQSMVGKFPIFGKRDLLGIDEAHLLSSNSDTSYQKLIKELRQGVAPSTAIAIGFDKAWATILDSNITTLIAGLALLAFGSGPIKGFAVVHCLGILTSMFSAVFFSRGVVNLWYGRKKKLQKISIGQIWRAKEK